MYCIGMWPYRGIGSIIVKLRETSTDKKTSVNMGFTMLPSWKLFPLSKLHEIEPLKSYMEATTTRRVDQLWTKEDCSSHSQHILGEMKTAC